MEKKIESGKRFPYESPESEMLVICQEEGFLDSVEGTQTPHYNGDYSFD